MTMMDPTAELALLEAAYTAILAGQAQEYQIGTRRVTKLDMDWLTRRMDMLRAQVTRQTNGMVFAGQFRKPE